MKLLLLWISSVKAIYRFYLSGKRLLRIFLHDLWSHTLYRSVGFAVLIPQNTAAMRWLWIVLGRDCWWPLIQYDHPCIRYFSPARSKLILYSTLYNPIMVSMAWYWHLKLCILLHICFIRKHLFSVLEAMVLYFSLIYALSTNKYINDK